MLILLPQNHPNDRDISGVEMKIVMPAVRKEKEERKRDIKTEKEREREREQGDINSISP